MKVLKPVNPSGEQLTVIGLAVPGPVVIRGAAGSGKTTTALYRLKQTVRFWQRRVRDGFATGPVRVLVLTYNKTLRGYLQELARADITGVDVELTIETFGRWSYYATGRPDLLDKGVGPRELRRLGRALGLDDPFLVAEVDYLTGRFLPADWDAYVTCERTGRGTSPRVPQALRTRLLTEVVRPFANWKQQQSVLDFNDLAVELALNHRLDNYDVVVVDETQDFSANQMRAVVNHLATDYSATFVLDGAQRIYPQRFQWNEVGLTIGAANSRQLGENHRNTREIAAFAAPLLTYVEMTDDSAVPDFSACTTPGPKPVLVAGKFSAQMNYVVKYISELDPDGGDTVAILHAKGWFNEVRKRLDQAGFAHVEITGNSEWPSGPECIALSTMHSAKGLEFDHVIIVGLNSETMPHDAHLRLLSMAIGRARKQVVLTYKPEEASDVIDCLEPTTYDRIDV